MNITESKVFTDEREVGGIEPRELLPCPFCGGEAKIITTSPSHYTSVVCRECLAKTAIFMNQSRARAAWNRRRYNGENISRGL